MQNLPKYFLLKFLSLHPIYNQKMSDANANQVKNNDYHNRLNVVNIDSNQPTSMNDNDFEIVGLFSSSNGRFCCSHKVCGQHVYVGDDLRLNRTVVDVGEVAEKAIKTCEDYRWYGWLYRRFCSAGYSQDYQMLMTISTNFVLFKNYITILVAFTSGRKGEESRYGTSYIA
jgi:hypothetical protein